MYCSLPSSTQDLHALDLDGISCKGKMTVIMVSMSYYLV